MNSVNLFFMWFDMMCWMMEKQHDSFRKRQRKHSILYQSQLRRRCHHCFAYGCVCASANKIRNQQWFYFFSFLFFGHNIQKVCVCTYPCLCMLLFFTITYWINVNFLCKLRFFLVCCLLSFQFKFLRSGTSIKLYIFFRNNNKWGGFFCSVWALMIKWMKFQQWLLSYKNQRLHADCHWLNVKLNFRHYVQRSFYWLSFRSKLIHSTSFAQIKCQFYCNCFQHPLYWPHSKCF